MNNKELIKKLFSKPIAYHRVLADLAGVTGAVMLSQSIYWTSTLDEERDGWFYKSQEDWQKETGLTRYEQEGARKKLKKLGILEEKLEGLPATLWYRINFEELQNNILGNTTNKYGENQQTSMGKTSKHTITENTADILVNFKETSMDTPKSNDISNLLLKRKNRKENKGPGLNKFIKREYKSEELKIVSHEPLTYLEKWQVAWDMQIPLILVQEKHKQVMLWVNEGKIKDSVIFTLKSWLGRDISDGKIFTFDSLEGGWMDKIALEDQHPDAIKAKKEKYDQLVKDGIL